MGTPETADGCCCWCVQFILDKTQLFHILVRKKSIIFLIGTQSQLFFLSATCNLHRNVMINGEKYSKLQIEKVQDSKLLSLIV